MAPLVARQDRVGGHDAGERGRAQGVIWGASFLFMKVALEGVTFGQVAWSRLVLGGLTLGVIVLISRPRETAPA